MYLFVKAGRFIICCLVNLWCLEMTFDLQGRQMADCDMRETGRGSRHLWGNSLGHMANLLPSLVTEDQTLNWSPDVTRKHTQKKVILSLNLFIFEGNLPNWCIRDTLHMFSCIHVSPYGFNQLPARSQYWAWNWLPFQPDRWTQGQAVLVLLCLHLLRKTF